MNVLLICIQEHQVYKTIWNASVGDILVHEQETQIKVIAFIRGYYL